MATLVYNNYKKLLLSGTVDLIQDPIYAMLLSGTYTPNSGHVVMSEVTQHQVTDSLGSYQSGGQLLTSKTINVINGIGIFDAADVSWSNATISNASGVVLWVSGSTPSARYLICWNEIGNQSPTNGTLQIQWNNTNGIFRIGAI